MLPRRALRPLTLALALAITAGTATAATRLTYSMGSRDVPVSWPAAAFPLQYTIDSRVVNALPGGAGVVDRAFAAWASAADTDLSFRDAGISDGVRAGQDGKNTISLVDDLFKDQKAIAITTNWYDGSGQLTEADIQIDASLGSSGYNVQQAITHEVGHLLGLDHSAVLSAIMYPYVNRGTESPQLDSDDRIGIASVYPRVDSTLTAATLQGKVMGDSGGIFAAQVVAMNEDGEPVATGLTRPDGSFTLAGIPEGAYRIYAEPLDGPVDMRNLAGVYRSAKPDAFRTQFVDGGAIQVRNGRIYGNLNVSSSGAPPDLNPRWIGVNGGNGSTFTLSATALSIKPGQTMSLAVAGDGITGGMTTFEVLNPGFHRTSEFRYAANYVYANFAVDSSAVPGSAVILVTSGNQNAALTGALRVQGPAGRIRVAGRR